MTLLEAIKQYLSLCPLLEGKQLRVDLLPEVADSHVVGTTPAEAVIRQYLDGSTLRQVLFTFSYREVGAEAAGQSLETLGFYEAVSRWIEGSGALPQLDLGRVAWRVTVQTCGYLLDPTAGQIRYQIQCKLIYRQERN